MTLFEELASLLSQTDVSALGSVGLVLVVAVVTVHLAIAERRRGGS